MGNDGGHESAKAAPAVAEVAAPALSPAAPFKAQPLHNAPTLADLAPDRRERRQSLRQSAERLAAGGASAGAPAPPAGSPGPGATREVPKGASAMKSPKQAPRAGMLEGAAHESAPFSPSPVPEAASLDTRQHFVKQSNSSVLAPQENADVAQPALSPGRELPSLDGRARPRRVMETWPEMELEESLGHGGGGGGGQAGAGGEGENSGSEGAADGAPKPGGGEGEEEGPKPVKGKGDAPDSSSEDAPSKGDED